MNTVRKTKLIGNNFSKPYITLTLYRKKTYNNMTWSMQKFLTGTVNQIFSSTGTWCQKRGEPLLYSTEGREMELDFSSSNTDQHNTLAFQCSRIVLTLSLNKHLNIWKLSFFGSDVSLINLHIIQVRDTILYFPVRVVKYPPPQSRCWKKLHIFLSGLGSCSNQQRPGQQWPTQQ